MMPPGMGRATPVVLGKASGSPLSATASGVSTGVGLSRSASMRIRVGLRALPPATIQLFGGAGRCSTMRLTEAAVSTDSVAGPSAVEKIQQLEIGIGKGVAAERFRARPAEESVGQNARQEIFVHAPSGDLIAVPVER